MSETLFSYNFMERLRLNNALASVNKSYGSFDKNSDALKEAVRILEAQVTINSKAWLLWNALGTCHLKLGEYVKAYKAFQKCYDLNYNDPRSLYWLATILWKLAGNRDFAERQQILSGFGLTHDQAVEKSMSLFQSLSYKSLGKLEAEHIQKTFASMCAAFPHLAKKVQYSLKHFMGSNRFYVPPDALFALAFEHAINIYPTPEEDVFVEPYRNGLQQGACLVYRELKIAIFSERENIVGVFAATKDAFTGEENTPSTVTVEPLFFDMRTPGAPIAVGTLVTKLLDMELNRSKNQNQ